MKRKIFLLPLFLLLLANCDPASGSSSQSSPPPSESESTPPSSSEEQVLTIAAARQAPQGTVVTTEGLITGKYRDAKATDPLTYSVAIQDGELALLLYAVTPEILGEYHVGQSIRVTGTVTYRYEIIELAHVSEMTSPSKIYQAEPLLIEDLNQVSDWTDMDTRLVTYRGIRSPYNEPIVTTEDNDFILWQNQGLTEAIVRIDKRLGEDVIATFKPTFDEKNYIFKYYEITGTMTFDRGEPLLLFYDLARLQTCNNPSVRPTELTLIPQGEKTTIKVGETLRIFPYFTPALIGFRSVTWQLSDYQVAAIDLDMTLTGKEVGTVVVTASWIEDYAINDHVTITVIAA
ncbi:MAG: Ig-like domain-containing protein [Bacilli bacterium]|jgi:hypothetical protein